MRTFLMALLAVLLLAAAAGFLVMDEHGRPYLLSLLHLGSIAPSPAGDEDAITVYKWQDAEGNWHYADTPPPGSGAQAVKVGPPTVAPEPPAAGDPAEEKGLFSRLPGVFGRAHEAGEKMNEQSDALKDRLDAASGP